MHQVGFLYTNAQIYICALVGCKKQVRKLLQFEQKNAINFIQITIILQHTNSYMFQALPAHCQGAHDYMKLLLNIYFITVKTQNNQPFW